MKTIRWIGAALVVAAGAIAAVIGTSEAGASVVKTSTEQSVMSTQDKQDIAVWVLFTWPEATPAAVERITCKRARGDSRRAACDGTEIHDLTAAQYAALEDANRIATRPRPDQIAEDGSGATGVRVKLGKKYIRGSEIVALGQLVSGIFGVAASTVMDVTFWAPVSDEETQYPPGTVLGEAEYLSTRTPVERLLCLRSGGCSDYVGVVE